jgi:arsenical pump membrane protein
VIGVSNVHGAFDQAWPPFALVLGLLLIGLLAHRDGLFDWAGRRLQRLPGPPLLLLLAALALVAAVTAVLNLDTAVVFLTPILVLAASRRGLAVEPFLYGCVFMANASSLFLPGSNLTNLLVLSQEHVSGASFALRILPEATAAAVVTAIGVLLLLGRRLREPGPNRVRPAERAGAPVLGIGAAATVAAAALVLTLSRPALPVLAVGLAGVALELGRHRLSPAQIRSTVGPASLLALFALTVALGTLARSWSGPAQLLASASGWETAAIAALGAIAINNLPASVLFSAGKVHHARMLLLGLNVGPNLLVTGALSALLWHRAAGQVGARPSLAAFSRYGLVLAPAAIAAALLVGQV